MRLVFVDGEQQVECGAEARGFFEGEEGFVFRGDIASGVEEAGEAVMKLRGVWRIESEQCAVAGDGGGCFAKCLVGLRGGEMGRGGEGIDRREPFCVRTTVRQSWRALASSMRRAQASGASSQSVTSLLSIASSASVSPSSRWALASSA